jgi:hypothetical protein
MQGVFGCVSKGCHPLQDVTKRTFDFEGFAQDGG